MKDWRIEKKRLAKYLHLPEKTPLNELKRVKDSLDKTYKDFKLKQDYHQFMKSNGIRILR